MYMYIHYIVHTHTVWSAVGVKIVFKNISALCGEYISQCIYKCVDVFINTEMYLLILRRICIYINIFTNSVKYCNVFINTAIHVL